MLCSPAEIEKKRREALQKLAKKGLSPIKVTAQSTNTSSVPSKESPLRSPSFVFKKNIVASHDHHLKPYTKPNEKLNQKQNAIVKVDFYGVDKNVTAKIALISSDRFSVTLTKYHNPVIDIFKTIPSKNYDPQTRIWNFHFKDYDFLLSRLATLKSQNVIVEQLPLFVSKCLKKNINNCDLDIDRLDPELSKTLLPFQLEGLRFGVERNGRCLIADDMGLGKTFQALAIMNYYQKDWPLLIVTTASMKNVWEETIFTYLPSVPVLQIQYMVSGKDYIGDSQILIISHELMSRYCDRLLDRGFGCIIIDESHTLKNFKAKTTQSATKLAKNAKRLVLLSGTPALSRPNELYSQLSLIDGKFFGSFIEYAKRYCDLQRSQFGLDSSGKSNLQELEVILNRKFMIRRTKEDVLKCMPKKSQEIIRLDVHLEQFSEEDRRSLKALAIQYAKVDKARAKHSLLLTFFAETAKIKIPSVCSHILQILEKQTKFLVFAHHLIMLDAVEAVLKRKRLKYIRIDGNTTSDQRKYFVDKFQTDDDYRCAVLSICAANAGITLTAAQLVIFAELHWNPSILSQAEARAHRIGQENTVIIQYLLADGTADDSIWPMLQEKQKILMEVGLFKSSYENVNERNQETSSDIASGLNISKGPLEITHANTLNISSYFKSPEKESNRTMMNKSIDLSDNVLDDGFDDVLCNMEI